MEGLVVVEFKKNAVVYPAILDDSENEKEVYTVTFPDVPEAFTSGNGLAEAILMGSEVLGAVLVLHDKLPESSDLNAIQSKNKGKIVIPIAVDLDEAKAKSKPAKVKKNTTIPGDVARKAEDAGINFSQTLTEALEAKLAKM